MSPKTQTPAAARPANGNGAKAEKVAVQWAYADALKEAELLQYFLKSMQKDPSGRHGNLRAALTHNLRLNLLIKTLLDEMEEHG